MSFELVSEMGWLVVGKVIDVGSHVWFGFCWAAGEWRRGIRRMSGGSALRAWARCGWERTTGGGWRSVAGAILDCASGHWQEKLL